MKKKNPWVAAILNFVFPGIGFAYLGSAILILSGVVFFISDLVVTIIHAKYTMGMASRPSYWVFSLLGGLALAVTTFVLTKTLNRGIQEKTE